MGVFALALGVGTLVQLHISKVRRRVEGWQYSLVTITGLFTVALVGLLGGVDEGSIFDQIYYYLMYPMQATMFSLLAFFIASASYRAFRARTIEAACMLFAAIIVMFGRVPIGDIVTGGWATKITQWILWVPNLASKRAIILGVALGMVATSLKIMLGIERTWLGGTE